MVISKKRNTISELGDIPTSSAMPQVNTLRGCSQLGKGILSRKMFTKESSNEKNSGLSPVREISARIT